MDKDRDSDVPAMEAPRPFDRLTDWLGAQGAINLTIYMCALVALGGLAARLFA